MRWLNELSQPTQDCCYLKPQPCPPRGRGTTALRRRGPAFLGSVKNGEDLSRVLVLLVEALSLIGLHTHHDAPFGLSYALLATPAEALRAAGLSARKVISLQDLSAKIMDGTVAIDGRRLARESDEEIVARLTTVRGIGKWSAEIFLMFQLRRLDVWPTGDLGVRKGYALAWAIPTPTTKQLDVLGEPYRPYRSVVAWYCWRAVQIYSGAARTAVTA